MRVKQQIQKIDELNHYKLRSDIEDNKIVGKHLLFLNKVGDFWVIAIDKTDIRYEYNDIQKYNEDVEILIS